MLQCNVHAERMNGCDKRIGELEESTESLKSFMWKVAGGLPLAGILFANVIASWVP